MGGYYQPTHSSYGSGPGYDDRRSSTTPSFTSQSSGSSPYATTPYAGSSASGGAESFYGGVKGQTPASAYANFHSGTMYNGGGGAGAAYTQPRSSMQTDNSADSRPSFSSSAAESIYGRQPNSGGASATSSVTSFTRATSPRVDPPRLPSFELTGAQNGVEEGNWFKGLSLDGGAGATSSNHSNGSSSNGNLVSPKQKGLGGLPVQGLVEEEDEDFRTPGPTADGKDPFASGESRSEQP